MNDPKITYVPSHRPWFVNGQQTLRGYVSYVIRKIGFTHKETKILMATEQAIGEAQAIIAKQQAEIAEPLVFRVLGRDFEVPFHQLQPESKQT